MLSVLSSSFALFALTPEAPALYAEVVEGRPNERYRDCVRSVETLPEEGRKVAERWATDGGGAPAEHCLALAELATGHPKIAAARLEQLASRSDAGDLLVRARILSQSSLAFIEADLLSEAESAANAAMAAAPNAPELFLTRAQVYFAQKRFQAAIEDVTAAEKEGFVSPRGYVVRGKARRALTNYRDAADDVVAALTLDPLNIDALTLRGDLAQNGVDIEAYYADKKAASQP
jgi:predicted Zn-dependent protease